jgi:hypothetical protein
MSLPRAGIEVAHSLAEGEGIEEVEAIEDLEEVEEKVGGRCGEFVAQEFGSKFAIRTGIFIDFEGLKDGSNNLGSRLEMRR